MTKTRIVARKAAKPLTQNEINEVRGGVWGTVNYASGRISRDTQLV